MKTIEYSACVDCLISAEYGYIDDADDARNAECQDAIKETMRRDKLQSLHGGEFSDEFSLSRCDICGSRLAGERHLLIGLQRIGNAQS